MVSVRNRWVLWLTVASFVMMALPVFAQRSRTIERVSSTTVSTEDAGTSLSVQVDTPGVQCASDGSGADVTLLYSVISTGAADSADLVLVVNGGETAIGTIKSGNVEDGGGWNMAGRTKTAEGSVGGFYENGTYAFQVCATQSGAGRTPKRACSEPVSVTIDCIPGEETSSCPVTEFYGEVVSNPQMCSGNGPVKIQVQFRGDLGSFATLDISGPASYQHSVVVGRNGESCTYHYNWDLGRSPASGVYTLSVNGGELVYGVTLSCRN